MKKLSFLLTLVFILIVGCNDSSKEADIQYFLTDTPGTYLIHFFYDSNTNTDLELLEYMNSSDDLLKVLRGIQLYDVNREDNQARAAKASVDDFPAILVTDDKEVVILTKHMQEVKDFFDTIVKKSSNP
ncbi:hypothetical protein M3231_01980 [Neobacillus mesonae]|nr:hypothetical protein [Neobacillus mesonae]